MRVDSQEYDGEYADARKPTKYEPRTAELVLAFKRGDIAEVKRIDVHNEVCRKFKSYHYSVRETCNESHKAIRDRSHSKGSSWLSAHSNIACKLA